MLLYILKTNDTFENTESEPGHGGVLFGMVHRALFQDHAHRNCSPGICVCVCVCVSISFVCLFRSMPVCSE
jgi:hypothetical protein